MWRKDELALPGLVGEGNWLGRCGWGSQHSPPPVPVKHLVPGPGFCRREGSSSPGVSCFLEAFYGLFRFPGVSSCWFCSVLGSSPGILLSWTLLGCRGSSMCQIWKTKQIFFHLRLLQTTALAIFPLSLPLAKADSSLCTSLCITQLFLALPLSFPSLLAQVMRLSWIIPALQVGVSSSTPWDFSSEGLVLADIPERPHLLEVESPCSEHPRQWQCQVIPGSCGCPFPG